MNIPASSAPLTWIGVDDDGEMCWTKQSVRDEYAAAADDQKKGFTGCGCTLVDPTCPEGEDCTFVDSLKTIY